MKYRNFGRIGWQVSEIGFGAWAIGGSWGEQSDADSLAALRRAIELGCNFIDTAQVYGDGRSERLIAKTLRESAGGKKIYIATKIPPMPGDWPPAPHDRIEERFPEAYLRERIEQSLRDLQTDCIDLMQLHTWTRAWNRAPAALEILQRLKREGKIRAVGVSTPEHDQNSVIDLMRSGMLDAVQVIYNIFDQEPAAELLPVAGQCGVAVIVRVPFDESSLTGKLKSSSTFPAEDFRSRYFAGDRVARTVERVEKVREALGAEEPNQAAAALKFCLKPSAISTVIPGIRNVRQAEMNLGVSDAASMTDEMEKRLRKHNWRKAFWYSGK